jgi:hypothetical protein
MWITCEGLVDARRLTAALLAFMAAATLLAAVFSLVAGALSTVIAVASLLAGALVGYAACGATRPAQPRPLTALDGIAIALLCVVAVRQFGWLAYEKDGLLRTWNAFNYGDLPLHWSYVAFLANGARFWPENPVFTGARLQYPFGMDLFNALWARIDVPIALGLAVTGLVASALLGVALRGWGGALAILALVLSGGFASSELAWKNLFLALVVPQRGLLFALPAGLLLLTSWRDRLLRGRDGALPVWVEGLLWGAMPLFHLHTFLLLSVMFALWTAAGQRLRAAAPIVAWALAPATWGVLMVTNWFRAASLVGWAPGWVVGDTPIVPFLATNFALLLPFAAWLLFRARADFEVRWTVLPALALWLGLFLVKLAPWAWDNTKVMIWCYLLLMPALGAALAGLAPLWRYTLLAAWLLPGAITVTQATFGHHGYEILDVAETEAVCRAFAPLPVGARTAAMQTFNHPVALCGHPLVAGYGGHLWSHGIAAAEVEARLGALMSGAPGWEADARWLGARYLFWGRREAEAFAGSPRPWEASRPLVAEGAWGRLYALGE